MHELREKILKSFFSWIFRAKNTEAVIFKYSIIGLVGIFGVDYAIGLIVSSTTGTVAFSLQPGNVIFPCVLYTILAVLSLSIVFSLVLSWKRFSHQLKQEYPEDIIVIEGRGLRDDDGISLVDSIPRDIVGRRRNNILDLRHNTDGLVISPEDSIKKISAMRLTVQQLIAGNPNKKASIVYGGLTSVPYTFLTGVTLDDEGSIITFDWDRGAEKWRRLGDIDDGERFIIEGLDSLGNHEEIVLAMAFSYPVNDVDIASSFNHPRVSMKMPSYDTDGHWSEEKQSALAEQFLQTVKLVSERGVKKIHLVLAAPNSLVFLFGRRYDKRNLPNIVVYQYERAKSPAYPWGISMPVSGCLEAEIVTIE